MFKFLSRTIRLAGPGFWKTHLDRKGKHFVLAAGFEELTNGQIENLRAHHPGLPTAVAKYERYRNYAYFAWAVALVQLSERLGGERWKKLKSALGKSFLRCDEAAQCRGCPRGSRF